MKRSVLISILTLCFVISVHAQTDYSDNAKIKIAEPRLAMVNITGIQSLPASKTDDMHAWMEYSDENGNYFKKRIILNAQGNSSLQYPKKNLSMDFCEDEWIGDNTTSIQIGNWVSQDGFHFKANWIDTFRGGLAVATAYKFYDDIVADEDPILKRAGFTDYSDKALCHPDGFPCVISLNGEFQGVYAWQLKKHRKNMDMEKDNPKHVWFQIDDYKASLDSCRIIWEGMDVKNPKELTEESKMYMENLAKYKLVLDSMENVCSVAIMREEIAKRFDVTSVIDYIIHGLITSNIDGFGKNINFFTYDGVKWFITPYDLDETFGNSWIARFQFTPDWSFQNMTYEMDISMRFVPFIWVMKYFREDIEKRYAKLRDASVVSTDKIMSHLIDWNERVGKENYELEYAKWTTCPSSSESVIDENWEWIRDWTLTYSVPDFKDTVTYQKGDICTYLFRVLQAKNASKGKTPVLQDGYTDTEARVREWLDRRIMLEDKFLNYNSESNVASVKSAREESTECRKIMTQDNRLHIQKGHRIYNPLGQKIQ